MAAGRIVPTRSWRQPDSHFVAAMTSEWYRGLVELQHSFTVATLHFWQERGAKWAHAPVTTGSISSPMGLGSDSSPVEVDLHGVPTFLADSMQFALEYLCRLSEPGAYYLMPSFRGEAADATHLCQFQHSEAEIPGRLDDVIAVVEEYVRYLTGWLHTHHAGLLARMAGDVSHIEDLVGRSSAFARLTFDEAVSVVPEPDGVHADDMGRWRSLTRVGERRLLDRVGPFVWVTHWDHLAVPFYQAVDDSGRRALSGDLLFGPGEVVGAGERHVTGDEVRRALKTHDVPVDSYEWYVTMKDSAPLRTAGFGMGVERYFMWLLRADDIRDFQVFPRENGRNIVP